MHQNAVVLRFGRIVETFHALDKLPKWPTLFAGFAVGGAAGVALILANQAWAFALFLALAAATIPLALSGKPVAVPQLEQSQPFQVKDIDGFITMTELPGGTFQMGSPKNEVGRYDNEGPVHQVTVSPFAIGKYQVTQEQYAEVIGKNPGHPQADKLPVNNVTWYNAVTFCNKLSERAGLQPCYSIHNAPHIIKWLPETNGYRLPTEAEWEYAARAGTTTAYSFGDDPKELKQHAWFDANSGGKPQPVGKKRSNPWDLHDVHGNVWEWCWDWYEDYKKKPAVDPKGPKSSEKRVLRGGAFWLGPRWLRSAYRDRNEPEGRNRYDGFRCVRGPRRQD